MRTLIAFFLVVAASGCSGGKGGGGDNTEEDGATLDGTFGTAGVASVPVSVNGSTVTAYAMALHSDGTIVVAGSGNEVMANYEATAAKFAANGTADPLFPVFAGGGTALDFAQAVALQADGSLVLAGRADLEGMLARFTAVGTSDAGFGLGGVVVDSAGGFAVDVAIVAGGKILTAGRTLGANTDFLVTRWETNGAIDGTFGTSGRGLADFGGADLPAAMDVAGDGSFVVAGTGTAGVIALAKFAAGGTLDGGFGTGGLAEGTHGIATAVVRDVKILSDGRIVVVGSGDGGAVALRLLANGSLDADFGVAGVFRNPLRAEYGAVAVDVDGNLLIVSREPNEFALDRIDGDGKELHFSVDATFSPGATNQTSTSIALQPDGKVLVGGSFYDARGHFGVARFTPF